MQKKFVFIALLLAAITGIVFLKKSSSSIPLIAIANYGPHSSLESSIKGFKAQMHKEGFEENKTIRYTIVDVGFDQSLIPQMLVSLKAQKPKAMIVMTTPIAQAAKTKINDIPLIYMAVTDPLSAGLIKDRYTPGDNMTGSCEADDLNALLSFAKSILPHAKTIGLLYATSESNDIALKSMLEEAALKAQMSLVAVPVEQARDVPIRMQAFKGKVDFIYVGSSGPIQPTLPAISVQAKKMGIPVFNIESEAVKNGLALASFGINYETVGANAARLAIKVLQGQKVSDLSPVYPSPQDHHSTINKALAKEMNIDIPSGPIETYD